VGGRLGLCVLGPSVDCLSLLDVLKFEPLIVGRVEMEVLMKSDRSGRMSGEEDTRGRPAPIWVILLRGISADCMRRILAGEEIGDESGYDHDWDAECDELLEEVRLGWVIEISSSHDGTEIATGPQKVIRLRGQSHALLMRMSWTIDLH